MEGVEGIIEQTKGWGLGDKGISWEASQEDKGIPGG